MKNILILFAFGLFFACKNTPKEVVVEKEKLPVKQLTKLERLYTLPKDSIYEYYDLSNDSIKEFPDLSQYTIKKLDLSHNQLDTFEISNFPKKLDDLNLSYNKFSGDIFFKYPLKKLDISHNKIVDFSYGKYLILKIILSHNDLIQLMDFNSDTQYLDVSNNPRLNNRVGYHVMKIDTIIYHNIANKKPLIYFNEGSIIYD